MPVRNAQAEWKGSVTEGNGIIKLSSGAFEGAYSFKTRMGDENGTNPEELIGAAHAGCFSMALAAALGQNGFTPSSIHTEAAVRLDKVENGFAITKIDLTTTADVPNIDETKFQEIANAAKENCPVSRALAGTQIHLKAALKR
jgi:osmotically inducible protein OsmC